MKRGSIFGLLMAAGIFAFAGNGGETEYKVNPSASKVEWLAKKVVGQHNGEVKIKDGQVVVKDGKLTGGVFQIDMASIQALDLEGEWKEKLEGHLRSDDFFSVEKHAVSKFEITKIAPLKEEGSKNNHTITGKLTIKGITNEITFPAFVEIRDGKLAAYADFNIDRTKWDIKYGSASFFEGLGDKAIENEFNIKLSLAAAGK